MTQNPGYGGWEPRTNYSYSIFPPPDDRSLSYDSKRGAESRPASTLSFTRSIDSRNSLRLAAANAIPQPAGTPMATNKVADTNGKDKDKLDDDPKNDSQLEFILACIGYAVGLGNVWRFPYLCYKNGGGAFLIPYGISLFIAGLPIFYLELVLGQFSSLGPNCIFGSIAPITRGIGWGMVMVSTLVCVYYNMIIAWVLFYLGASFRSTLQWSSCMLGDWYTHRCFSKADEAKCVSDLGDGARFFNLQCFSAANITDQNLGGLILASEASRASPAEEYFERYVLAISDGFDEMGGLQWKLVLANLGAWCIIFACLAKGVQSTGKVVYFTATFPYLVLVILLIRGATLDGAGDGVHFYMTADWSKLAEVAVWKDAAVQIFYSLGPAWGGLITMSSYNRFHNNCFRDALIVAFTNCGTSVFAGFAIFSVVGFMAKELGKPVSEVVRDGAGLAFIAYPEAITRMPLPPLWAVLFFFMLLTLGLDSQFAQLETVTTAVMDQFPKLRQWKTLVVLSACIVMFILGLPLCTNGGMYVFTLLNDYSAGYCLILIALAELVTVCHLYGIRNFTKDIEMMLGTAHHPIAKILGPSGWYWRVCWFFITPMFLFGILICSFAFYTTSKYGNYVFGPGAELAGWALSLFSVLCIPIFAVVAVVRNRVKGKPFSALFRTTPVWGPALDREKRVAAAKRVGASYVVNSDVVLNPPYNPDLHDKY